jgi:hypothetical protein
MVVATPAFAANGNIPRTPPVFPPHACLAVVDRSVDARYEFKVGIPFEDVTLTADELPDSRTFEFFAICRDDPPATPFPNWIDLDDAQRALDVGNIEELPSAEATLAGSARWSTGHDDADGSCVQSMGPRIAISCDATQDGLAWDTTGVPAGNYAVHGYTFAPPTNLWTPRTGVVQVHDGTPLPVAAFASPIFDATVFQQSGYHVQGCMGGPAGTEVVLAWAPISADLETPDVWTDFATLDAADAAFDVVLVPPESAIYQGLVMRATATADGAPTWVAYSRGYLTIYPGDDESDDPELPAGPDHCEVGEEPTAGLELDGGDATTTSSSGAHADGGEDGCGCDAGRRAGARSLPLLAVLAVIRRSRASRVPPAAPNVPK